MKHINLDREWENERIGLKFDGVMMHTTVEINGSKVGEHHYGYTPFYIDITDYVTLGAENRITSIQTAVTSPARDGTRAAVCSAR